VGELVEYVRDRWEWDSVFRDEILLAVILGTIGLAFAWLQSKVRAPA
jgi:hypothetical protein